MKNVVLVPSGAVNRGWLRTSGDDLRVPSTLKRIGTPPSEVNPSGCGGEVPNSGVFW